MSHCFGGTFIKVHRWTSTVVAKDPEAKKEFSVCHFANNPVSQSVSQLVDLTVGIPNAATPTILSQKASSELDSTQSKFSWKTFTTRPLIRLMSAVAKRENKCLNESTSAIGIGMLKNLQVVNRSAVLDCNHSWPP